MKAGGGDAKAEAQAFVDVMRRIRHRSNAR